MSSCHDKYLALEELADVIRSISGRHDIDHANITVTLAPHFWHMSLSDVMASGPMSSIEMLSIERKRAFEIHGIKFIRGEK